MTAIIDATPSYDRRAAGSILVAGIVLATLTEAIASTVLSLGRNDIIGDTHATPDEFAWLDVGYTATKLVGFMTASWLLTRTNPRILIIGSTLVMGTACGIAAITYRLDLLVALRMIQGFSGGTLLVAGQSIIFLAYPRSCQPILQALVCDGICRRSGNHSSRASGMVDRQPVMGMDFLRRCSGCPRRYRTSVDRGRARDPLQPRAFRSTGPASC